MVPKRRNTARCIEFKDRNTVNNIHILIHIVRTCKTDLHARLIRAYGEQGKSGLEPCTIISHRTSLRIFY